MRLPFVLLKFLIIWTAVAFLPSVITYIFLKQRAAALTIIITGLFLVLSATLADTFLKKTLRPSKIKIGPHRVFAIEDPSSHAFATQGFLSSEPSLWITRGALSLLSPEEIINLLNGMKLAARQGGLRFETALTAWLVRLTEKIPPGFHEILFFRQKRSKKILIRESALGTLWISVIFLLEYLYFKRRSGIPPVTEEVLHKLEAESRRCVPRLPAALSSHAAVSPWPDALLTIGRPCLLPQRTVNSVV